MRIGSDVMRGKRKFPSFGTAVFKNRHKRGLCQRRIQQKHLRSKRIRNIHRCHAAVAEALFAEHQGHSFAVSGNLVRSKGLAISQGRNRRIVGSAGLVQILNQGRIELLASAGDLVILLLRFRQQLLNRFSVSFPIGRQFAAEIQNRSNVIISQHQAAALGILRTDGTQVNLHRHHRRPITHGPRHLLIHRRRQQSPGRKHSPAVFGRGNHRMNRRLVGSRYIQIAPVNPHIISLAAQHILLLGAGLKNLQPLH